MHHHAPISKLCMPKHCIVLKHNRLECSGKDGCNSVDFKCTNPTLCSVTCKDGEPACNSLTVRPRLGSSGKSCARFRLDGKLAHSACFVM